MRKIILFLAILILSPLSALSAHFYPERYYQDIWCQKMQGITEYKLSDNTRVDCLTKKYAIEFDFAPKWAECIGQALYYGKMTEKIPCCALILEKDSDREFIKRLDFAINKKKKIRKFKIFIIDPINTF